MIWTIMLSIMAFRGTSNLWLTLLHSVDPGMAPSREKAQIQREEAVVQPIPHMMARTRRGMVRAKAPPAFPNAAFTITGTGWAERMRFCMSGRTKRRGIRNNRPANVLMKIVMTIAFGT